MNIALVTGLWDIGRDKLANEWSRSFRHYLDKLAHLLKIEENLIIFGDKELEEFVKERRDESNTQFIVRDKRWFTDTEFYDKIQLIRNNPNWLNQSGWLADSTQGSLDMYNPLVMSKMFLLNDARIMSRFDAEYLYWIDAGITNTVHPGYFTHDKIHAKFPNIFSRFGFVAFPYKAETEIHGFSYPKINEYAGSDVKLVCRGGLFGGHKSLVSKANSIYYNTLAQTLGDGYMGTEESIFSIMLYRHPDVFEYCEIEENGLICNFCEDVKTNHAISKTTSRKKINFDSGISVGLYIISFNSPKQFRILIESMLAYDKDFIHKTRKFLLDNSTDLSTTQEYIDICEQYGFEHIKKDNIGITGGRVFVADHFDSSGMQYYWFFEDDMKFYTGPEIMCRSGFTRKIDSIFTKSLQILTNENLDFLKLNFTEFYGSHAKQWAWYNVDQEFRKTHWPNYCTLPTQGLDPNSPCTEFKHIKSYEGIAYAIGEVYLSNWPIILSKEGNYKCYIETKYDYPFEQTLMSHCYKEMCEGKITAGVLLATPTEHDRFDHYEASLRKEF